MAYAVYSFASQYTDTGLIGIYVGTREENLGPCVEICSEQIGQIAAGRPSAWWGRSSQMKPTQNNLPGLRRDTGDGPAAG